MKKTLYSKTLKFVAVFLITATASYFVLSLASSILALTAAYLSQFFLSLLGIPTQLLALENPHLVSTFFDAELIDLCWGLLEMAVIIGVIFASQDRTIKQRIFGILGGIIVALLFNAMRIAVTLKLFNPVQPFASEIAHDVLFRISLVLIILGYYALWYAILSRKKFFISKR